MLKSLLPAAIDRLKERGTWRGIVAGTAGLFGFALGAEYIDAIAGIGVALLGVVEVIFREHGYITNSAADNSI